MKVDSQKIIADTLEVFSKSTAQKEKFSKIKEYISTHDYLELHTNFLTPTTIKINSDQFLKEIPLSEIVLETDAPYLAPTPFRGKRNESSYLLNIAQKLADIYGVSVSEIAKITTENSKAVFGI